VNRILAPFVGHIAAALILALTFAGVQTWRIGRLKYEANVAAGEIKALQKAKDDSEALRDREGDAATASFDAQTAACSTNFAAALSRGRLIERAINAPSNPDGSRAIIDASVLRPILGQTGSVRSADALPR
jgi:hypothetical protein